MNLQPQQLSRLVEGISLVIHTAGLAHVFDAGVHFERQFHQINEIGTINMISAAIDQGVKHFILISTVSVYGPFTEGMYDEETPCNPLGPYALSKYNAEQRAQEIAQKVGMSLTILRLATLYGEGDPGNVGRLMHALDRGRFFWIGNGNNRKSLLYNGDAARLPGSCFSSCERVKRIQCVCSSLRHTGYSRWPCDGPWEKAGADSDSGTHCIDHREVPLLFTGETALQIVLNNREVAY